MAAARDHIVEQMDDRGPHWPGFQRVKKRKIQDRFCFRLAVEAQHQGDFEVVEQLPRYTKMRHRTRQIQIN